MLRKHLTEYPTTRTLNFLWNFGSLAFVCLLIQLITGILLVMFYCPNSLYAFDSVVYIMREVNQGWLLRFIHANTVSLFFLTVFAHILKALYWKSYRNKVKVWKTGVVMLFLLMATAFIGYVLPWGQMSFWGATVITNLVTALPIIGQHIAIWIWGGFAVDNATLTRFFSLHYLLPFVIFAITLLHLYLLHQVGSTTTIGTQRFYQTFSFFPIYTIKDLLTIIALVAILIYLCCISPDYLLHADNYIPADPLITPHHIVPEWYFLPYYAILRACPNKVGGVIGMLSAILILWFIPTLDAIFSGVDSELSDTSDWASTFWFCGVISLEQLGSLPADQPFTYCTKAQTCFYWFCLLVTCV